MARLARHTVKIGLKPARFLARRLVPKLGLLELENVLLGFGSTRSSSENFDEALARLARARKFLVKVWLGSLEPAQFLARSTSNLDT